MSDLITWLPAQLDEDERVAREGTPFGTGRWIAEAHYGDRAQVHDHDGGCVIHDDGELNSATAEHIALHDPARVLAEVEAKRRILDAHADAVRMHRLMEETDDDGKWDWLFRSEALEGVVQLLALPFADRPGYREDWRP